MTVLALLHALGTLDGAFAGFRAAQGRTGIVRRRAVDARALAWGAAWAQVPLVALELAGLVAVALGARVEALQRAGVVLALVYGAYAAVIGAGFALRLLPSVDARAASSILVLGPGTLLRGPVLVAGALAAVLAVPTPEVGALAGAVPVAAIGLGLALDRAGGRFA